MQFRLQMEKHCDIKLHYDTHTNHTASYKYCGFPPIESPHINLNKTQLQNNPERKEHPHSICCLCMCVVCICTKRTKAWMSVWYFKGSSRVYTEDRVWLKVLPLGLIDSWLPQFLHREKRIRECVSVSSDHSCLLPLSQPWVYFWRWSEEFILLCWWWILWSIIRTTEEEFETQPETTACLSSFIPC